MTRECGRCTWCCVTCEVRPLGKDAGTPCVHIADGRCGVYDERPQSCRAYRCSWLAGDIPEEWSPTRCGVVFETATIAPITPVTWLHGVVVDLEAAKEFARERPFVDLAVGDVIVSIIDESSGELFVKYGSPMAELGMYALQRTAQECGHIEMRFADGGSAMVFENGRVVYDER